MKLVATRRAIRRVQQIGEHIRRDDSAAARRVQDTIFGASDILARQPGLGRPFRDDVRRYVVPRLPYLIFYRADEARGESIIVAVRHARQRPL